MSNPSPDPKRWSHWLILAAAVFPPLAAFLGSLEGKISIPGVTNNPWAVLALFLGYEFLIFFGSMAGKVGLKVQDLWVDRSSTYVDSAMQRLLSGYGKHYRHYFWYEHRDLDVKGLSTIGTCTLGLEEVFVDLRIDSKAAHQAVANPLELPKELREGNHSIWEYLQAFQSQNHHFVILGLPGSGKTTLMKHLGLTLVHRRKAKHQSLPRKLPLLLFLREHSASITTSVQQQTEYSLADAMRKQVERWKRPMPPEWIERYLDKGKCLVLLDGLDEVVDLEQRRQVVQWVQQQMVAYGKNRFVVTSRPFGYRSNPLDKVMTLEVQSFTPEQVKQFIQNWYLANEIKSAMRDDPGVWMKAEDGARDLFYRLEQSQRLMALVVNPLLLTMVATVHRYRGSLPGTRVMLYKEVCEVFLGKRQEARGVQQELRVEQRLLVLQELAYQMMTDGTREIECTRAQKIIREALQRFSGDWSPQKFLQQIEQVSGLLLERENGVYTFAHLTFQEYLAVVHIREKHLEHVLLERMGESWWREAIRLYCAQAEATAILEACAKEAPTSVAAFTLALECLEQARDVQPHVEQQIKQLVEQWVEDQNTERRRVTAEALLAQRLDKMVQVKEGVYCDRKLITCAEYQLFLDDQKAVGKYHQPDHWPKAQFAPGQALMPVVGLRPSDAQAFSSWLTENEQGLWQYRLPKRGEILSEQVQSALGWETPLGYWANEGQTMVWMPLGGLHEGISQQDQVTPLNLDLDHIYEFVSSIKLIKENDYRRLLVDYSIFTEKLADNLARTRANASTLVNAGASALALVRDLTRASDLASDLVLASDLARVLVRASTRARTFASDLDLPSAHAFASNLALASNCALALASDHDRVHASASNFALALARSSDRASDLVRDLINVSTNMLNSARMSDQSNSDHILSTQLPANLSICICICSYELWRIAQLYFSSQPSRKHLFALRQRQETLDRDIEIYERLKQLDRRIKGEEHACEGILIVKERK